MATWHGAGTSRDQLACPITGTVSPCAPQCPCCGAQCPLTVALWGCVPMCPTVPTMGMALCPCAPHCPHTLSLCPLSVWHRVPHTVPTVGFSVPTQCSPWSWPHVPMCPTQSPCPCSGWHCVPHTVSAGAGTASPHPHTLSPPRTGTACPTLSCCGAQCPHAVPSWGWQCVPAQAGTMSSAMGLSVSPQYSPWGWHRVPVCPSVPTPCPFVPS